MEKEVPLTPDLESLPDDPVVLKQMILQLFEALQEARHDRERIEHHMDMLLRRLYGRTSEKFDPRQGVLFDVSRENVEETPAAAEPNPTPASNGSANRHAHGRGKIPDSITRVEEVHDLTEAEKEMLGGPENLVEIGVEVSEQYDWKPSCLFVVRHIQKKYARRELLDETGLEPMQQNVIVASKPAQPIPGGLAAPGLLAQIITSKYTDHLPLYRLEGILERQGARISRQTLDGWVLQCVDVCWPLYHAAIDIVLASQKLHTDDTPVKIRDAHKKLKHTGRFWTYVGDEEHPLTVFDYTPSRKRDGPAEFLKNYHGYLQADAFNGYDGIYLESNGQIQEVGCWAHARRKYFDGRRADPAHAEAALAWIGKLYGIEKELRERTAGEWLDLPLADRFSQIAAVRQERSRPLLSDFQRWLEAESPKLLPKNPIRQAMDYTLGNWSALSRYIESGRLAIDNNAAENSLRGICLGRKNWLFCGSDRGGRAAAVYFSLIASCKRHEIDPFAYLRDILRRLPTLTSSPDPAVIDSLLPHRWQPA
jgi:transposase